jgi:xanthine dehydrogenase/oxidase
LNGNTEVGIETRFKNLKYPLLVNASDIKDLKKMVLSEQGFEIGTGYTWSQVLELLTDLLSKVDVIKFSLNL